MTAIHVDFLKKGFGEYGVMESEENPRSSRPDYANNHDRNEAESGVVKLAAISAASKATGYSNLDQGELEKFTATGVF